MKKKLYCFDFDGTLTTSDTLLEFIRYAKGTGRFLMVFLMYSPLIGDIQDFIYDLYLKGNKIQSGRKNYSEVIGLLISYEEWKN